jgi:hypothetical protein
MPLLLSKMVFRIRAHRVTTTIFLAVGEEPEVMDRKRLETVENELDSAYNMLS